VGDTARAAHASSACDSSPVWHDGTGRPIQRPADPEAPEEESRGQPQQHTRTPLLVIQETWHMAFLRPPSAGQAAEQSVAEFTG
jgi:hypothetical protein